MSDTENIFRDWMDEKGLSAADVAGPLHVEEQTVRNWRSQGVPSRRQAHVEYFMNTWPGKEAAPQSTSKGDGQNLVIHPTAEQFRSWNLAALEERMTIEDWAINGLNELASQWLQQGKHLRAAEEQAPYDSSSKLAG